MALKTIGRRIAVNFGLLVFLIVLSGLLAGWQSIRLEEISTRIRDVRGPTIDAAMTALNGLNQSQSVLKSWLLFGNPDYKEERAKVWREQILPSIQSMETLSTFWSIQNDVDDFKSIYENLSKIGQLQSEVENLPKFERAKALSRFGQITPLTGAVRGKLEELVSDRRVVMDQDLKNQAALIWRLNVIQALLVFAGGVLGLVMGVVLVRRISGPLHQAVELANRIADGHFGTRAAISGFAEVDRLGRSLERMRINLERQTWLSRAQIAFASGIRGVESVRDLADAAAGEVARSVRALSGAFYAREERSLRTVGGFAFSKDREPGYKIEIGEGLAGQCATEKRFVSMVGAGELGLRLQTSAGHIAPEEILALPLTVNNEVLGVMEFGLPHRVEEHEKEFLFFASEAASIALNSMKKSEQVKNLLAETQTMAEELQAQQEELRSANDELQTRQEELESTNEELEEQKSMLEDMQRSLAERAEELDRVSRYKSEFLANMSHELRTPLNSQLILSRLLEENKEGNLTDKQKEFARVIHSTGVDLLRLINDILDLSKVEAGRIDLEIRDSSLAEIVADCERDFRHLAENKGLEFACQLSDSLPATIRTDSHRLVQVIKNFLSNALKFTARGEIRLTVHRPGIEDMARFDRFSRDSAIAFTVSDTGIGIPQEKLSAVFEAFQQVDSSVSRQFGGTGLGLAIARSMSNLLGGEILLRSRLKEGSAFTLIVPEILDLEGGQASPSRYNQPQSKVSPPTASIATPRVLVVEDNDIQRQEIVTLFSEKKATSVGAASGEEALKILREESFDCIVVDLSLPDMSGFDVLKSIRSDQTMKTLPAIVYTSKDLTREEEDTLKKYSEAIVIKGLRSSERLIDEVSLFLNRPTSSAPKESSRPEPLKADKAFEGKEILLVDDDVRNIFSLSNALETTGFKVSLARNGEEALSALGANPKINLVLMDIMMPVMDGYEATRRIRENKVFGKVPVIALTAKAMKGDREACLAAGANDYLSKPVDLDRLLTLLRVWLVNS